MLLRVEQCCIYPHVYFPVLGPIIAFTYMYISVSLLRTPLRIPVFMVSNEAWSIGAPYITNPAVAYFVT